MLKRLLCLGFILIVSGSPNTIAQPALKPPVAWKEPRILKIHGYEITDNYAWLSDRKDNINPAIIQYLTAENVYTDSFMSKYKKFINTLYKEMLARIQQNDMSVPYQYGKYWYFTKIKTGMPYPVYMRSKSKDGNNAMVLLDQNSLAKNHKYFAINDFSPSDDGNFLAFTTDTTGYRQYMLQILDLKTGKMLPEKMKRVTSIQWSNDGKYLFISQEDAISKRSDKIWQHTVGTNQNELIFEEKDVTFNSYIERSRDRRMLFIHSMAKTMDEYRFLATKNPVGHWKIISPRREGHKYNVDFDSGAFFITTNKNAENFKVVKAPATDPNEKNWKDFIPHNPDVHIDGVNFFKNWVVLTEKEHGLEYIRVLNLKSRRGKRIQTPESVYTMSMAKNPEYDTPIVRYNYASMITPDLTLEYNFSTQKSHIIKQMTMPDNYDKTKYETKRIWAKARDATRVPILLLMKKGTKLDGSSPMLLYGYGSYGVSLKPDFASERFSLVDRGMIYAIALIRGGGEMGEKWRLDGRMYNKLNTFYDFLDCAKWLEVNKYTSADKLVIQGASAGGLLMGAVANMSPETFHAVIAQVPFVDVMNTMLDANLPLTTEEWTEWGNPHNKKDWDYMFQYSPYDNVKAQAYPAMLIEISLNDSQVPYWEGAKFAEKIREMKTNDNVILLKTNMNAGHGGSSGRYEQLKEVAFTYTFALSQVGITH